MPLDMHVVVWTCDFFACSVSEGVLDMHTHHTLTNTAMGVYFTLVLMCLWYFVWHACDPIFFTGCRHPPISC